MQGLVEQIIILAMPKFFYAVAQIYRNWRDVPDQEVLEIMKKWQARPGGRER